MLRVRGFVVQDFSTVVSAEAVNKIMPALKERGFLPEYVASGQAALQRIKKLIPPGASVMNGSSRTLEQIGYIDHLKAGKHGWDNLHETILAEKDQAKQAKLRRESVLADYYLGSVHAVAQTGELVIASNTGSQLPHLVYTSPNLILVVGAQKITPDVSSALERLFKHVYPLEDQRMKDTGAPGSYVSKLLIFNKEQSFLGRKVHIIFVGEALGF